MAYHLAFKVKCLCLFATHFHELTQLEEENDDTNNSNKNNNQQIVVSNVHVTASIRDEDGFK